MIEEEEDLVSDGECATAVDAVTRDLQRITTYLSFCRKGVRKAWLLKLMNEYTE